MHTTPNTRRKLIMCQHRRIALLLSAAALALASAAPAEAATPRVTLKPFAPPPTIAPGASFALTTTVTNLDHRRSLQGVTLRYYVSTAAKGRTPLRAAPARPVAVKPRESLRVTRTLRVPATAALGRVWVTV